MARGYCALLLVLLVQATWEPSQAKSVGKQPLSITDTLIITYSSAGQRTQILQQILVMWRNALTDYQPSDLVVTFQSETTAGMAADPALGKRMQVTYKISGSTMKTADVEAVRTTTHQTIIDAHVAGVELMDGTSGSPGTGTGDDSGSATPTSEGRQTVSITDTLIITYSTTTQRTQVLQQILVMWRNALDMYQATDLTVTFVSEKITTRQITTTMRGKHMEVTYQISGFSLKTVDVETVRTTVHQTIVDAHLAGVELLEGGTGTSSTEPDQQTDVQAKTSDAVEGRQTVSITDTVIITYTSTQQRTTILQQIMVMWRNALNEYQASDIKITFVSETTVSGQTTTTSSKRMQVTYKITGFTAKTFEEETVRTTVHQTMIAAHLTGVELSDTPATNSDNADNTPMDTGRQTVSIVDTVYITYRSSNQRTTILQQIMVMWRNVLDEYQASDIKVELVSEQVASGQTTSTTERRMQVTYRITGFTVKTFSEETVRTTVHQTILDSHLAGVELMDGTTDSTDASTPTDTSTDSTQTQTGGQKTVSITDTVVITYTTTSQRTQILQQIMGMWRNALDAFQASDLKVIFVSETPATGETTTSTKQMQVTYKITGFTAKTFSVETVRTTVHRMIVDSRLAGVELVRETTQSTVDTSNTDTETTPTPTDVDTTSARKTLSITDTVIITYTSTQQRTQILQQILDMWRNALDINQATDLTITFVSEVTTSQQTTTTVTGTRMEVTYRISGFTVDTVDVETVRATVHQTILDSHLAGVELVVQYVAQSATEESTTMTSMDTTETGVTGTKNVRFTDTVTLAYSAASRTPAFSAQMRVLWTSTLSTYQVTGLTITFISERQIDTDATGEQKWEITYEVSCTSPADIDEELVKAEFHRVLDASQTTDTGSGNKIQTADTDATQPLTITDTVVVAYTSNQQRAAILRQILSMWKMNLDTYGASGLTISTVSENPTPTMTSTTAQQTTITYRITGVTTTPVDLETVRTTVHQKLADIDGVQLVEEGTPMTEPTTDTMDVTTSETVQTEGQLPLLITDSVFLPFMTTDERDALLQQILTMWTQVLEFAQTSNLQITFVRQVSDENAPNTYQVFYKITGRTVTTVDMPQVKAAFRQKLHASGIAQLSTSTTTENTMPATDSTSPEETESTTTETMTDVEQTTTTMTMDSTTMDNMMSGDQTTGETGDSTPLTSTETMTDVEQTTTTMTMDSTTMDNMMSGDQTTGETGDSTPLTSTEMTMTDVDATTTTTMTMDETTTGMDNNNMASGDQTTEETSDSTTLTDSTPLRVDDTITLGYTTKSDLSRNLEWLRRVWAFVLGLDLETVRVTLTNDVPLESTTLPNGVTGHNVSYSLTVLKDVSMDVKSYLRRFRELLPSSTENFIVFPTGKVPTTINLTVIEQIRGPQTDTPVVVNGVRTFLIYDSLTFQYNTIAERDSTLEMIRRAWEQTVGRDVTVELTIQKDMPTLDGSHQIFYMVTILSQQATWDIEQLTTKFRQVLINNNVLTMVLQNTPGMTASPSPILTTGASSAIFYDTVMLTYTTNSQRDMALTMMQKAWQRVFGTQATNVKLTIYEDIPQSIENTHVISYSILFTPSTTFVWDFVTLRSAFDQELPTVNGDGFTAATAPTLQSRADLEEIGTTIFARVFKSTGKPIITRLATKTYFFTDGIKLTYTRVEERDAAMKTVRFLWEQLLGSSAIDVQIVLTSDSQTKTKTVHEILYSINVVSTEDNLDLSQWKEQFWTQLQTSQNILLQKAERLMVVPVLAGSNNDVQSTDMTPTQSDKPADVQTGQQSGKELTALEKWRLTKTKATTVSSVVDSTQDTSDVATTEGVAVVQAAKLVQNKTGTTANKGKIFSVKRKDFDDSDDDGSDDEWASNNFRRPAPPADDVDDDDRQPLDGGLSSNGFGNNGFGGSQRPRRRRVNITGLLVLRYSSRDDKRRLFRLLKEKMENFYDVLGLRHGEFKLRSIHDSTFSLSQLGADAHTISFELTGKIRPDGSFDERSVARTLTEIFRNLQIKAMILSSLSDRRVQVEVTFDAPTVTPTAQIQAAKSKTVFSLQQASSNTAVNSWLFPSGLANFAEPVNSYVIHESFQFNKVDQAAMDAEITKLETVWNSVLGQVARFVKLIVYQDVDVQVEGSSENTHDVSYVVVFLSNDAGLDLQALKSSFEKQKPTTSTSGFSAIADYPVIVLRDSVLWTGKQGFSSEEWVKKVEKLWKLSLGSGVEVVESWLFDDSVLDAQTDDSAVAGPEHQLSFVTVVISKTNSWSVESLRSQFDQFVVSKSIAAVENASCQE